MSNKSNVFVLLFFMCCCFAASAQESMISSVSDAYVQRLIDTAKKNYPRIEVFNKRIENAQTEVKRAKMGWFDAFSFSWLYSPNNATTLVNPNLLNGYQVGMFVNVGSLLQKPATIKKAKTDVEISKAERDEYNLSITALVKQRYYLYVQSLLVLKLKSQALMDVEGSLQQTKYKFEKGEETLESYNKDLVSYEDRIQGKMEAESSLLIAKSNLEELLGTKLESIP